MDKQATIIQEIKNACSGLFTRISEKRISENDISDTELPALIISSLETIFEKQVDLNVVENYEIKLMFLIKDDGENFNPISKLAEKQTEIIKAILTYRALLNAVGKDGIILKGSSISNSRDEFSKGSAAWGVLTINCHSVVSYGTQGG